AVTSGWSWTGGWIARGVPGYGVGIALGFAASGFPTVAHGNGGFTGGIRFLARTASGWGPAELLTDSGGRLPRMVYDGQGTAWVALTYSLDPTMAIQLLHRTSTGWITETVLAAGGGCERPDLALDAAGNAAISMEHAANK